jgi:hypothetical protein
VGSNAFDAIEPRDRMVAVAFDDGHLSLDDDSSRLIAALGSRGVGTSVVAWSDSDVDWSEFDLVVVRLASWGIVDDRRSFVEWAERTARETQLCNAAQILVWNSDKRYLADLRLWGVPTIETTYIELSDDFVVPKVTFVVKPTVSAGGYETARYEPGEHRQASSHVERLLAAGRSVMVQPYRDDVDQNGERELIFFDGKLSHVVRKEGLLQPGAGVVEHLWTRQQIASVTATAEELAVAGQVLEVVTEHLAAPLYARIDLVRGANGAPELIEAELIDPMMFFRDTGGEDRFADAILGCLAHS